MLFQSYQGDISHYSCLSCVSPVQGWALKCLAQGHSHEKNPEDLVRLEPRTPRLQVKDFITEPHRTPCVCGGGGRFITYAESSNSCQLALN